MSACPFFLPNDMLQLHNDIFVHRSKVIDRGLGVQHRVQPQAATLLRELYHPLRYVTLLESARAKGVTAVQLHELLGFLNSSGALVRRRSSFWWITASLALAVMLRSRSAPLYKRFASNNSGTIRGVYTSCLLIALTTVVIVILWVIIGVPRGWLIALSLGISIFIGSLVAHEQGHLLALKRHDTQSIIVASWCRIGVLHARLHLLPEVRAALAGPLAGASICIFFAVISVYLELPVATVVCMAIGGLHLCNLLPWYQDGKSLHAYLLNWRQTHAA